jgi:hypothetical protein
MHLLRQERVMVDREVVIDLVLNQIQTDIEGGDLTAIEELLTFVPLENLIGYLPEGTIDTTEER